MQAVTDFMALKVRWLSIPLVLLMVSAVNAQEPEAAPPAPATTAQPAANPNYKIGPGDVLDVTVSKNAELSRAGLRVGNNGTIQLPMLDTDVPAACMTERELADSIKENYRKYLVNPYVNVTVREFNSNPVAVIGAVNSPGRFQLQRQIRLVELLTFVNGPSKTAGQTVEIIRDGGRSHCEGPTLIKPDGEGQELLSVNLANSFKNSEGGNPLIFAGDIVRIAEADQLNAYIQGSVRASLAISLKEPVTLTQAIAMAGGASPGAETTKVKIRRQIPNSINREEILANVKAINQGKSDDILLLPNDIVDVPGISGGKKIFHDFVTGLLPSITRLPLAVIP
jgi:polysaccharide export outer membrane protein